MERLERYLSRSGLSEGKLASRLPYLDWEISLQRIVFKSYAILIRRKEKKTKDTGWSEKLHFCLVTRACQSNFANVIHIWIAAAFTVRVSSNERKTRNFADAVVTARMIAFHRDSLMNIKRNLDESWRIRKADRAIKKD